MWLLNMILLVWEISGNSVMATDLPTQSKRKRDTFVYRKACLGGRSFSIFTQYKVSVQLLKVSLSRTIAHNETPTKI